MPHDRLLVLSSSSSRRRPLVVLLICVVDRSFLSFLRARCGVPRWFRRPSVVPLTTRPADESEVHGRRSSGGGSGECVTGTRSAERCC